MLCGRRQPATLSLVLLLRAVSSSFSKDYSVTQERIVFDSYRRVSDETVAFPEGQVAKYEVLKSQDAVFCL